MKRIYEWNWTDPQVQHYADVHQFLVTLGFDDTTVFHDWDNRISQQKQQKQEPIHIFVHRISQMVSFYKRNKYPKPTSSEIHHIEQVALQTLCQGLQPPFQHELIQRLQKWSWNHSFFSCNQLIIQMQLELLRKQFTSRKSRQSCRSCKRVNCHHQKLSKKL